jgi:3-deoxy-D-manno-octulosonate 8-phosphate phosphatase (KDO 8-P phosphatase)
VKELYKNITCFVLDVDGVLTDGSLICAPDGAIWRNMNAKDGYAIQSILKCGMKLAIITSGDGLGVLQKLETFGVTLIYSNVKSKEEALIDFTHQQQIPLENIVFIGDDIPDYYAMKRSGMSACPADAVEEIKQICHYVSPVEGGKGCVRDIAEQILKAQNKWFKPNQ